MNKTLSRYLLLTLTLALALLLAAPLYSCGGGGNPPGPPCPDGGSNGGAPGGPGGGSGGGGGGCCGGPIGSPGNAINTFTGDLTIADTPVSYQSVGDPFPFTTYFNSDGTRTGPMGNRWRHSYMLSVLNDAPYGATLLEGDGKEHYFSGNPTEASPFYTPEARVRKKLKKTWNASHVWTGWQLIRPNQETLTFDTSGMLTARTDSQGFSWSFSYSSGLLSTATDPLGRQTTFTYTSGYLTRVTVPGGAHADFTYDTATPKKLLTVTDAGGYQYTYTYTGTRIASLTDPTGRRVEYTYDANGRVASSFITGLSSSAVSYTYIAQGNGQLYVDMTETKDGANRITRHVYENTDDPANGRYKGVLLSTIVDVGGIAATQAWAYNSNHRVIRARDSYAPETGGKDHVARYYYTSAIDSGLVTKYIDPENYDSVQGDNSPGYVYTYNSYGQMASETTPEGRYTQYNYTTLGNGASALSSVVITDADVNGNTVYRTTSYSYYGSGEQTYRRYQLYTMTDARGNVTTYNYDSNGYLDYSDPPLGNNTDYTCNSVGDVIAITDGNGNTTSYQYDNLHRVTQVTFPDIGAGQKTRTTTYTCCGADTETDENGVVTKYEYDQYTKRLKKVTQDYGTGRLNYVTEYTYDEVGNRKTEKNARLKTTTYTYDDCDRKTRVDYPDSTYETWAYRDDGRVYTHTDARGRTITYRYDADDRLAGSGSYVAINYPNDTDVQMTRDKDGLITSTVDASGTTTNVYYPSKWLKTTTVSAGSSKTITYQYNGVGLVSDMAVSGESSFTYSYNARNQLDTVTNPNSVQVSFTYDNGGRRTRITDPGSYVEYVYNARNWITDVRNRTTGGTTRYDATYYYQDGSLWDHTGNPVKRVENLAGSTYTTTLRYDAVYRQTEETKRDSSNNVIYTLTYGYDAVGNRTTRALGGTTITYSYDDNNKLTSANDGSSFGYDSNGNMTSVSGPLGSKTMVYDDENDLTSIAYGGVTDLYYYNSEGQRYRARLAGTYYRYLYNGERVLEELNDSGTMQARYTTMSSGYGGLWLHLYRPTGTLSRFPMYDHIGTARGLVDASGTVTDTYELDTFGQQVSSTGTTPNPYRFGGAWGYITDPSGMLQLGVRYYWPELGRFVSQDPARAELSWYAYAGGNPVRGIDPDGRKSWSQLECEKQAWAWYNRKTAKCKHDFDTDKTVCDAVLYGCTIAGGNMICVIAWEACMWHAERDFDKCMTSAWESLQAWLDKCKDPKNWCKFPRPRPLPKPRPRPRRS